MSCLYERHVNRTYADMAAHYGTTVLPTRPRRPRDKAKVEAAVLVVERWILARLRHQRLNRLAELNAAIGELLHHVNEERPIRRLGVSRRQLLEELDRSALKPLPTDRYVFAEWRVPAWVSTTTSMSRATSRASPIASRAARWRCGSSAGPWRSQG